MPIGLFQIAFLVDRLKVVEIGRPASGDRDDVIGVEGPNIRSAPANDTPMPIRRRWPSRRDSRGTHLPSAPKPQQYRVVPSWELTPEDNRPSRPLLPARQRHRIRGSTGRGGQ